MSQLLPCVRPPALDLLDGESVLCDKRYPQLWRLVVHLEQESESLDERPFSNLLGTVVIAHDVNLTDFGSSISAHVRCYQPQVCDLFCSLSHACSGAKYSRIAVASICLSPVSAYNASGHGFDAPIASIARSFSPTTLLP